MTTTTPRSPTPGAPQTEPRAGTTTDLPGTRRGRPLWPLAGAAAGVTGLVAAMASITDLTEADYNSGVDIVDKLNRTGYHVAFILGLVSIACLLVASTGWKRWADERAGDSLAARTIPTAMAATATINIIGVAMAGSLALYLPGGTDAGWIDRQALFVIFTYLDFGMLLGWWGVLFAAGCVTVLAFGRRRTLPRWMGIVSVVLMAPPILTAALMGLPGLPGLTMPLWLTIISIGMVLSRSAHQRSRIGA